MLELYSYQSIASWHMFKLVVYFENINCVCKPGAYTYDSVQPFRKGRPLADLGESNTHLADMK